MVSLVATFATSGISIVGNKPFAAYSGNIDGYIEPNGNSDYMMVHITYHDVKKNLFLQTTLLPTTDWGTEYPLVPFSDVNDYGIAQIYPNAFQIVADTDSTIVDTDEEHYVLNAGDFQSIVIFEATMLKSNFPVQVIQLGQVWTYSYETE